MCHTLHGAGWMEWICRRSSIARDAGLSTLFKREVSTSHQVCIGGQTPGSPISGQDFGNPCVEVVLFDPILAVAPAIWWAPRICANGLTSSHEVSGTHCSKKRWRKTTGASPRQEHPLWKRGPGQHAKRCSWVRSLEPVSVWLAPASRQAQRKVSGRCRTGALRKWCGIFQQKCENSSPRSPSLWTRRFS